LTLTSNDFYIHLGATAKVSHPNHKANLMLFLILDVSLTLTR